MSREFGKIRFEKLTSKFRRITVASLHVCEQRCHLIANAIVCGISIDIAHLGRVGMQVIKLPFVNVVIVVHQLVAVSPHAVVTFNGMDTRVLVIMIVGRIAEIGGVGAE